MSNYPSHADLLAQRDRSKRNPVACLNCRQRKLKCIRGAGDISCERCRASNLPCEIVSVTDGMERHTGVPNQSYPAYTTSPCKNCLSRNVRCDGSDIYCSRAATGELPRELYHGLDAHYFSTRHGLDSTYSPGGSGSSRRPQAPPMHDPRMVSPHSPYNGYPANAAASSHYPPPPATLHHHHGQLPAEGSTMPGFQGGNMNAVYQGGGFPQTQAQSTQRSNSHHSHIPDPYARHNK